MIIKLLCCLLLSLFQIGQCWLQACQISFPWQCRTSNCHHLQPYQHHPLRPPPPPSLMSLYLGLPPPYLSPCLQPKALKQMTVNKHSIKP